MAIFPNRDKLTLVKGCKLTERAAAAKKMYDPCKWPLPVVKQRPLRGNTWPNRNIRTDVTDPYNGFRLAPSV